MVVFRSESLSFACVYLKGMFGLNGNLPADGTTVSFVREFGIWFALAAFACFGWRRLYDRLATKTGLAWLVAREACWIVLLVAALSSVANSSYSPFIYFNF